MATRRKSKLGPIILPSEDLKNWSTEDPLVMPSPVALQVQDTCAAHAMVGATEAVFNIRSRTSLQLSPQVLLDWFKVNGFDSKGAPSLKKVYKFLENTGLSLAGDDDEAGRTTKSNKRMATIMKQKGKKEAVYIKTHHTPDSFNENALLDIISFQNPVIGIIQPFDSFKKLKKNDVWRGARAPGELLSDNVHAVLIVGHGRTEDGTDYWLIKNSYGTEWGNGGYGRTIRQSSSRMKSLFMQISYPVHVVKE